MKVDLGTEQPQQEPEERDDGDERPEAHPEGSHRMILVPCSAAGTASPSLAITQTMLTHGHPPSLPRKAGVPIRPEIGSSTERASVRQNLRKVSLLVSTGMSSQPSSVTCMTPPP